MASDPLLAWTLLGGAGVMGFSLRRSLSLATLSCVLLLVRVALAGAQQLLQDDQPSASQPEAVQKSGEDDTKDDVQQHKAPDRVFGILPNYTTVEDARKSSPVTTKQAFRMASENSFDRYVFPFVGAVAALGVGQGGANTTIQRRWRRTSPRDDNSIRDFIARRYPTALADNAIGNFMTTAVLPSMLHQDPRYFELGVGNFWHRAAYAASRSVVTRSRTGSPQFNVSEIGGNAFAAMVSNAYYRPADRSATSTLTRWGMEVMWDTVSNELKEFWPDIRRKLHHDRDP